ncbi:hypothetical protein QVD17_05943 [Tagetes erecta]|uniref:CCT domain-containing protein n=1 Tax=Tagetes erecta TaxID=13708 RepID=A0AAD8PAX8_TARER|nr:hypothetical protein QVD17_05943 [Tagetes erecta]
MAFISRLHNFSGDLQTPEATNLPMWYHDDTTSSEFLDKYGIITMTPDQYDVIDVTTPLSRSSSWKNSFPERFGVSEMAVPTSPTGFSSILAENDYQKVEQDDYFGSNGGYGSNSWSAYNPTATNNWETTSQKTSKDVEESTLKVGRYSTEERKDKIMRYLKKRNQRNFNKTIKYECRKTLADKRVRVRGRFAKNNHDHHQPCEDQMLPNINTVNINPSEEEIQQLYTNNFLMKQDYDEDEEWLQEAMASLLY